MFPIKAKEDLPVTQIWVHSVAVRGELGPLSVYVSKPYNESDSNNNNATFRFPLQKRHWTRIYQGTHAPSRREYQWLDFSNQPVVLQPGQVRALYIHSTLEGDEAIVYDNAAHVVRHPWQAAAAAGWNRRTGRPTNTPQPRYQDAFVSIWPGKAHLSPQPFGQTPIWGWG